jgi:hypothetical protein
MKFHDFPFDFIPEGLLYVKEHSSEYVLDLTAA